jgi:hypothetical protein
MNGHYRVEADQIEDFLAAEGVREWVALYAHEDGEQAVLEVGTRDHDEPAVVVLTAAHLRDMASRFAAMADDLEGNG